MATAERTRVDQEAVMERITARVVRAENWPLYSKRGFEPILNIPISRGQRDPDTIRQLEWLQHEGFEVVCGDRFDHELGRPKPDREFLTVYIGR